MFKRVHVVQRGADFNLDSIHAVFHAEGEGSQQWRYF